MTRDDGFAIMDVSTSICDDSKFRRLQRENPEQVPAAFTAYVATMAESWKAGRRISIEDAWPAFLPFDDAVRGALIRVGLLDSKGRIAPIAWRTWFGPALERRRKSRARWSRYNASRDADTTGGPRGSDAGTATSVPSVPPVRSSRPSGPTGSSVPPAREQRHGLKALNGEDALRALDAEYAAERIDRDTYYARKAKLA